MNEFSYDRFRANAEHIFRVDEIYTRDDGSQSGDAGLNTPLAHAMKKEFPDVVEAVRLSAAQQRIVKVGEKVFRVPVAYADPKFLPVFSFPLLAGKDDALKDVGNVVRPGRGLYSCLVPGMR